LKDDHIRKIPLKVHRSVRSVNLLLALPPTTFCHFEMDAPQGHKLHHRLRARAHAGVMQRTACPISPPGPCDAGLLQPALPCDTLPPPHPPGCAEPLPPSSRYSWSALRLPWPIRMGARLRLRGGGLGNRRVVLAACISAGWGRARPPASLWGDTGGSGSRRRRVRAELAAARLVEAMDHGSSNGPTKNGEGCRSATRQGPARSMAS
jgi:hypothetical protein